MHKQQRSRGKHHTPRSHHTPSSHHTPRSHHTPSSHQARDDATSPTPTQHDQRHSPSNEHRVVTLPAGRMEARHGRGAFSRQNARARRRYYNGTRGFPALFPFPRTEVDLRDPAHLPVSEARRGRGRGGVSSPDWRVRMLRVQKRAGRKVESFSV